MSESAELLPCPFCGPGQSKVDLWFDDAAKRWRVGCGRCGCSTGTSPRDKTEAPAIAAWNRRAADPEMLEALRFIADRESLTFAECTVAEEIVSRARAAIAKAEETP